MGRYLTSGPMTSSRAERLIANAEGVDAIIISNGGEPFLDSTFWYVTEQASGLFEGSMAVISSDGTVDVMVSPLEEQAAKASKGDVHVFRTGADLESILKEVIGNSRRIGVNYPSMTLHEAERIRKLVDGVELVDVSDAIGRTVSVKDDREIAAIGKACKITSSVAREIPDIIEEGMSETEASAEIDILMKRRGAAGNAFVTIAAFGSNSAECHHMPTDYRLRRGDVALFDFGARYDRYCSDLTRTVFMGDPPEVLKRAYEVVKSAQEAGLDEIRPGVGAREPDLVARKIIDDSEFKGGFIHSFGHGIGMDIHQGISVSPRSEQILQVGNVISAEPGIYIPGIGGVRIEDTVLVTEDGHSVLTEYDHGLTVI